MHILSWLLGERVEVRDRHLGSVQLSRARWQGSLAIGGDEVGFDIGGGKDGPAEAHRNSLLTLQATYSVLRPRIGHKLWELHQQYTTNMQGLAGPEFPHPSTADAVLETLILSGISVHGDGRSVLLYTYRELADDAMFEITVDGDQLSGEYVGD